MAWIWKPSPSAPVEETQPRNDEIIQERIVEQFAWDPQVDASKITVTVDEGMVTLKGTVENFRTRQLAALDAWSVGGVRDVRNDIMVVSPEPGNDYEIKQAIHQALEYDFQLAGQAIAVETTNGWVTLRGTVDAFWKKQHAENVALSISGVVGITNELGVTLTAKVSDEEIAQDIERAFERSDIINVDDITVAVENGRVTLTGVVLSWRVRDEARRITQSTAGVYSVNDALEIGTFSG